MVLSLGWRDRKSQDTSEQCSGCETCSAGNFLDLNDHSLLLADTGLRKEEMQKWKRKRRKYKTMQPNFLNQLRGKKLALLSDEVSTWIHLRAWWNLLMFEFENFLVSSHWGWKKQLLVQWATRTPQGKEKHQLQENSLLSLSCISPWPPSLRSCPNPPEHDSNICLGDLTEVNAVLCGCGCHKPLCASVLPHSPVGWVMCSSCHSLTCLQEFELLSLISKFSLWMVIVLAVWGTRQSLYWWA